MRMIFHHPLPIVPGSASASGIRPLQMMEAFRSLGIEVDAVCGYAAEREQAVARIERNIGQGVRYAFMYGESSTEPTLLTNPHHLPLHPWLDFGFFARLKARSIPLGVFYRDIYWRFPGYGAGLAWWKKAAAQLFYRYDLLQYRRLLTGCTCLRWRWRGTCRGSIVRAWPPCRRARSNVHRHVHQVARSGCCTSAAWVITIGCMNCSAPSLRCLAWS